MKKENEKQKELKTHRITFRLNTLELEEFEKRMQDSGAKNRTDYIKACILNKTIKTIKVDQEKSKIVAKLSILQSELNAIGKNINQVTKITNSYARKGEFSGQVFSLQEQLSNAEKLLERYRSTIKNLAKFIR